jgi:hypothetical protein
MGSKAGHEGRILSLRDNMVMVGCRSRGRFQIIMVRTWEVLPQELFRRLYARERGLMSEESVDARPLTSVELLDAVVWREIGSEEAQPAAAFLDALSRLVGRWLLVRSDAPEMDAVTVLCKARGYIARQEVEWRR